MSKLRCAVVGATGVAGQQFLAALAGHPQFELVRLGASARSAGKRYDEAITDPGGAFRWYCSEPLDPAHAALRVEDVSEMRPDGLDVVFSALDADVARTAEARLAEAVPVLSTASAFRYEPDVPVLLPGVNFDHARLLGIQRQRRGWKGFIAPGPNCTTVGLAMTLKPLADAFGLERVVMTSLQSVSGAGRSPGVAALDIIDNVIPFIAKEEEKVERETRKILGQFTGDAIASLDLPVSCTCTRVNVLEGHTESVFVALGRQGSLADARAALTGLGRALQELGLPSMPSALITVSDDPYRPQPRLDRNAGGGMTTVVGRLREDHALGGAWGLKYVLVSHNTKMGAARGTLLVAEYLVKFGYIS